jgi:hypothetical protein
MGAKPISFDDLGGKLVMTATGPAVTPAAGPSQTFDFSDLGGKVIQPAQGQVRNDVGNTVIVPKPGESFADTMRRAAAYGQTVTPQQINAEMRTAPAKAAATLAAAPVIGAAGAAALAGTGEAGSYAFQTLKNLLPSQATADQIIKVAKMVRDLSLTAAAGKYLYHTLYGEEK